MITNIINFFKNLYNSLEWCLSSSAKPYAFVSLPLQSSLFSIIKAKLTVKNIYIMLSAITVFLVRYTIIYMGVSLYFSMETRDFCRPV